MKTVNYLLTFFCLFATRNYCTSSKIERDVSHRVTKKAFSDKVRLLFNAGLEGTGHHYVDQSLHNMFEKHKDIFPLNVCDDFALAFSLESSMTRNASYYVEVIQRAKTSMQHLALVAEGVTSTLGRLATLQGHSALTRCKAGDLSYPNFGGPEKALQYVDLRTLADCAETEGVDLRVVYLKRNAKEIMISTTRHRTFQRSHKDVKGQPTDMEYMRYMRILLTDLGVLHSMLAELGNDFIICHDYSILGDPAQAKKIAKFIAPTEEMAEIIETSLIETASHSNNEGQLASEFEEAIASRLQRKLDVIDSAFCDI